MKALLCCKKEKLFLRKSIKDKDYYLDNGSKFNIIPKQDYVLNGKILIECDFEVKEIGVCNHKPYDEFGNWYFQRGHKHNSEDDIAEDFESLLNGSCLNAFELNDYLGGYEGYAIHVKNLKIFDEPKELKQYYYKFKYARFPIPVVEIKGMMYVYDDREKKIIIPVSPEEMYRIANEEQTVIIRRKVLKEMI